MKAIVTSLTVGIMALAVANCSSSPSPKHSNTTTVPTTTSTSASTTTTTAPAPMTTTTTAPQIPSGFALAKSQWEQGAMAASADQAMFWTQAASDLTSAAADAGSNAASYNTAVQELRQLVSIPEMGDTPSQITEAQSDTVALNAFFGTPDLYS